MRQFQLLTSHTLVFEQYSCQTTHTLFSGGHDSQQLFVPVEVIAAQMVTSTSLENLFYLLCELLKQNFDLDTTKTLILHVWFGFFFNGVHLTKLWSKKIFFMKTLSKLGALTIQITV